MLSALIVSVVLAQGSPTMAGGSVAARLGTSTPAPADFLNIMVASSSVGTVADDLCAGFPGEVTGSAAFCVHGDGTATNQTLTQNGAASLTTAAVCPNGTDCADVNVIRAGTAANAYYRTDTFADPAGNDYSLCVNFRLLSIDSGVFFHRPYLGYWYTDSNGSVYPANFSAAGDGTYPAVALGNPYGWQFICNTYHYVADGTSLLKTYLNGTLASDLTDARGPIGVGTPFAAYIGTANSGTTQQGVDVREIFYTEKVLSAATILAMDKVIHIRLKNEAGTGVVYNRNSPSSCPRVSDGALVQLNAHEPCVNANGAAVWEERVNEDIRSEEFCDGAWTCTNATATCDTHPSPTGTLSADTLATTSSGGFCESTASALTGSSAGSSIHARSVSGTQTGAIVLRDTTAGATKCTGTISGTTAWLAGDTRANCFAAITSGDDHSTRVYPGGVAGAGSMVVWGVQREVGESMSPYVKTLGTAVGRSADGIQIVTSAIVQTSGCWAATIKPTASTTAGAMVLSYSIEGALSVAGSPSDHFALDDGESTTLETAAGAALAGTTVTVRGDWAAANAASTIGTRVDDASRTPGTMHLSRAGAGSVSGTFGGDFGPDEHLWLGSRTLTDAYLNGYIRSIKMNVDSRGCQP